MCYTSQILNSFMKGHSMSAKKANDEFQLITIGVMSERLDLPIHLIRYWLKKWQIEPVGQAGRFFIYSEEQFQKVAAWFIEEIKNRQAIKKARAALRQEKEAKYGRKSS